MNSGLTEPEHLVGASLSDDRFRIVARIGAGSMALVYRAFDHRLETDVVIKVPRKEKLLDASLRERFRLESRMLVQLQHPHIVRILDIGMLDQIPYVVMQYLSGGSLADRLVAKDQKPVAMRVDSLRTWLMEVARALDFAHQMQVVHRDVKPANILFDEFNNAFLSDFGLTKIMYGDPDRNSADATGAGMVVGTPSYVAPEIVLGRDYDGRADQYSLAISVYHALIGTSPMQGRSPSATMVNQTRRTLPLLSDVRKSVPKETASAVARAISKNPAERFASCLEFATAAIQGLEGSDGKTSGNTAADSSARLKSDSTRRDMPRPASGVTKPGFQKKKSPGRKSASEQSFQWTASETPSLPPRQRSARPSRPSTKCPVCHKTFHLRPEHAGRTGRCVQCATRLRISDDLSRLTLAGQEDSSAAFRRHSAGSADDLIIGESVLGFRMSRGMILATGLLLTAAGIAAVIAMVRYLVPPESQADRAAEFRSIE